MQIKQFEDKGLSQFSYALYCEKEKIAAIIDPLRDVDGYVNFAKENGLMIKYILETHIHADFASGALELQKQTGATLKLSGHDTKEVFEYAFAHDELKDGDELSFGSVKIKTLHTPGHTPEHISFLATDIEKNAAEPVAFFSGDFLFLGSLGRPDLLGNEHKEPLARLLYNSVKEKLKDIKNEVEVLPGHGAGSLCGAGMSKAKSSTMGLERETNPYLNPMLTEDEFVKMILDSQSPYPPYYVRMKKLNSAGQKVFGSVPSPKAMDVKEFMAAYPDGVIVDFREPLSYGSAHIEGSVNIPIGNQPSFWAAWVVPYDMPIYILAEEESQVDAITRTLIRVGLDEVKGYLQKGIKGWIAHGEDFDDITQASVHFLDDIIQSGENINIIDVRTASEYADFHIKNAKHIYLGDVPQKTAKLAQDVPVFCVCGGGSRSSVAASLLQAEGFEMVYNVFGGMSAWRAAGLPTEEKKAVTA